MTKKFTSVLLLLVSCVMSALAQQVASTPTTWSKLESGNQYLVLVKSDKTNSNGNFMYLSPDDKYAHTDAASVGLDLIGSKLTDDDKKYLWIVTKEGKTITIKSKLNNTGFKVKDRNDVLNMSSTLTTFDVAEEDNAITLSYYGSYWFFGTKYYTTYVTSKDDSNTGSFNTSEKPGNSKAKFIFYAVEQPTKVTYNYIDNQDNKVRYSYSYDVYEGQNYPESSITSESLPTYVSLGQTYQPTGLFHKATSETTFNFDLNVNLPFTTSTDEAPVYYYLVNGTDTRNRVYANGSSLAIRTDGQAAQLNDVRGDLWYVKGNPFDGFQFSSVGSGHLAKSSATLSNSSLCSLAFSGSMSTDTWKIYKIDDEAFGIYGYSTSWTSSGNNVAWTNDGNNRIGFEKDLSTTDATKTFRLIPATITMPLNYSEADDKTFATTCLPYAVEVAEGQDNIKAYAAKLNDEKTELQMNAVTAVPANQGIILSGESASDDQVVLNVIASADAIDNDLLGTTSEISTEGILSLGRANGTGSVGFFRSTNATLKANRAYLKVDNETIQSLAMNFGGTTTGITNVVKNDVAPNAPIYDLSGRRVFTTVKGNIYLQQGRKFIAQ